MSRYRILARGHAQRYAPRSKTHRFVAPVQLGVRQPVSDSGVPEVPLSFFVA